VLNRGRIKRLLAATLAMCSAGIPQAVASGDESSSASVDDRLSVLFEGLAVRDGVARDRAERALAGFLHDPGTLLDALALADRSNVPEAKKRFARAVVEDGRTFGALLVAARVLRREAGADGSDPSVRRQAIAAEDLLILSTEAILAAEGPPLLQKGELEDRAYVFKEGLVTGLRFPLGPAVQFANWVDWLGQALPANRPLVADPRIELLEVPAVETIELLPTTADALLRRVLSARGLGVLDLGVTFVIAEEAEVRAFRKSISTELEQPVPEGEDDGSARRRERRWKDRLRARWLVDRILDSATPPVRFASLFQAVAPPGAREALVDRGVPERVGDHSPDPSSEFGSLVTPLASFGVDATFDLPRIYSGGFVSYPGFLAVAFRDLGRRPSEADALCALLSQHRDDSIANRFGLRIAAECQSPSSMERFRALWEGGEVVGASRTHPLHAALARFEVAPLDPPVRAYVLERFFEAADDGDLLRAMIQEALILAGTEEDPAAAVSMARTLLESTSSSARVIGAAVAGSLASEPVADMVPELTFPAVAKKSGIRGAEAWLLARIGSPIADETLDPDWIASGLAMDLSPSVEAILRAHAFRSDGNRVGDQVKAASEEPSGTALAALLLEAIRDSVHDGYRASFLKSAVGRLPKSERTAAIIRELSEVLRAAEPGAEVIWLDPRRRPPHHP